MPKQFELRHRIIKLVREAEEPLVRTVLLRKINASDRPQASRVLSDLLSENIVVSVGRGSRGSPIKIIKGQGWTLDKCPTCNQEIKS